MKIQSLVLFVLVSLAWTRSQHPSLATGHPLPPHNHHDHTPNRRLKRKREVCGEEAIDALKQQLDTLKTKFADFKNTEVNKKIKAVVDGQAKVVQDLFNVKKENIDTLLAAYQKQVDEAKKEFTDKIANFPAQFKMDSENEKIKQEMSDKLEKMSTKVSLLSQEVKTNNGDITQFASSLPNRFKLTFDSFIIDMRTLSERMKF